MLALSTRSPLPLQSANTSRSPTLTDSSPTSTHPQINGNQSMDTVFDNICAAIDKTMQAKDPLEEFCASAPEADEVRPGEGPDD